MLKNIKIKMISFLYKVLKPAIKVLFGILLRFYFAKKLKFEPDKVNSILILYIISPTIIFGKRLIMKILIRFIRQKTDWNYLEF
jgi:hypothetical protein